MKSHAVAEALVYSINCTLTCLAVWAIGVLRFKTRGFLVTPSEAQLLRSAGLP